MKEADSSTSQIEQAKATAIQYFKDQYGLDVEITEEKKLPTYVSSEIAMEGHVAGHKEQSFNISVNYKDNTTKNFVMSPELEQAIRDQGHDPFAKEEGK
ncbi:hypothetical protein Q5741_14660 [Paenibacillus sp. JX-17]|uniref:Lipoprotein n=1 Tax=Paenibacillus lacisoli TaxID=3064525 RepID=A0ABT9CEE8_9BACL|nr:hypothetical protein [Paenibacillus sp. JX-17]MDO7907649.1 hypothetical protein [Paenibacillus sp. JX-17]